MIKEEENKKKVRVKIERDAYPVLLSFKGGATSFEVEQRLQELFGFSYTVKYQLAGVQSMHQILMEHPEISQRHDGKFEIIANEYNEDLVALVSKQKDKVGGRSMSCIGYHKSSTRPYSRFSPKPSRIRRPLTSISKKNIQKIGHQSVQYGKSAASNNNRSIGNAHRFRENDNFLGCSSSQQLLVYPKETSTFQKNHKSCDNSSLMIETVSVKKIKDAKSTTSSALYSNPLPSIKQFSENVKLMMLKIYPEGLLIGDMTSRYFQEYGAMVDPSKLFSKSWMMLSKTTFKDWLEIVDRKVTLRKNAIKCFPDSSFAENKTSANYQLINRDEAGLLNGEGMRRGISPSSSTLTYDIVVHQMKDLTLGARPTLPTPEKPPGTLRKPGYTSFYPSVNLLGSGKPEKNKASALFSGPFIHTEFASTVGDFCYDSIALRKMKNDIPDEKMLKCVSDAIEEFPYLKQRRSVSKKIRRATTFRNYQATDPRQRRATEKKTDTFRSKPSSIIDTSLNSGRSDSQPSSLSPLDAKPVRMGLDKTYEQIKKSEIEPLYIVATDKSNASLKEQVSLYHFPNSTSARDKSCNFSCTSETIQASSSSTSIRKQLLPPMSKGALQKPQSSSYIHASSSSTDSLSTRKMRVHQVKNRVLDDVW